MMRPEGWYLLDTKCKHGELKEYDCEYCFGTSSLDCEYCFGTSSPEWFEPSVTAVTPTDFNPSGQSTTPNKAAERKATPIYSGVLEYFPQAIEEVARCSHAGNEQHNPGEPLNWNRSKSGDEKDALVRHLLDAGKIDSDGIRHSAKVAWRALASLQKEIESESKEILDRSHNRNRNSWDV